MPIEEAEQLVVGELNQDLSGHSGVRTIQHKITFNAGQHVAKYDVISPVPSYKSFI